MIILHLQKENPRIFPPTRFHLDSSRFITPAEVASRMKPKGQILCQFLGSLSCTSSLRWITPHLLNLPVRFTILHWWFQICQCNHALSSQLWARRWLWSENLAFASSLSTVDTLESISQDIHAHHGNSVGRWIKTESPVTHGSLRLNTVAMEDLELLILLPPPLEL